MGWYIATVTAEGSTDPEGYCIVDSVTGGIVRPVADHPQSLFSRGQIERIAAYLDNEVGDPRKGEHYIDRETLRVLLTGEE